FAALIGVIVRVSRNEIDRSALRVSRILLALAALVVVAYILGVAGAPFPAQARRGLSAWLLLVDQLAFLWAATVAVRVLGVRYVATMAAVGAVAAAGIGVYERISETSYARWWFHDQFDPRLTSSQKLQRRGTNLRSRATADFALQYAWVLAMFMPLVFVLFMRTKRVVLGLLLPGVMLLALYLSVTRSAYVGVAIGSLAVLFFSRGDRRILAPMLIAGVLATFFWFGTSAARDPYAAAEPESIDSRSRRLEAISDELSAKPLTGIGLDGLTARNVLSTDLAYLQIYAGAGVIGLALLGGALVTSASTAASAAFLNDHEDSLLAAAVLGGIVSGGVAAFSFDSLSGAFSSWTLWLLGALAIGLSEVAVTRRERAPVETRAGPSLWRVALPVAGVVAGLAVWSAAPTHVAMQLRFFTLVPAYLERDAPAVHDDFVGRLIINATCDSTEARLGTSVEFRCRDPLTDGPGTGLVRIEGKTRERVLAAANTFEGVAFQVHPNTLVKTKSAPKEGKSTAARTAPVYLGIAGAELALLAPWPRRRRSPETA
ncbi:MAG: hypothetical protein QOF21_2457, partial [Actinomycetota bacterium]